MKPSPRTAGTFGLRRSPHLPPGITELGLQCSSDGDGALAVPEAKRLGMIEDIKAMQPPPAGRLPAHGRSPRDHVETVIGRCGHLAMVAPEANAYMSPMYRVSCSKVSVRTASRQSRIRMLPSAILVSGSGPAVAEFQRAISWWRHALESGVSTPLAPRLEFPSLDTEGVAFMFTDAARDYGTGHGAFTMVVSEGQLLMLDMDPRWPDDLLLALRENDLSMPAGEALGAVAFADALAECLPGLTHLVMYGDSTPVQYGLQSGNSDSTQLNYILRWLLERRPELQLLGIHQPGKRNGAADGLSRLASARIRREAEAVGARVVTLPADPAVWTLARAARAMPQR